MLAIDYRLAPEHKHPDMTHDAISALSWLWQHGPRGPMAARSVFVVGDSAGGGLAVSLCVALLAEEKGEMCVWVVGGV